MTTHKAGRRAERLDRRELRLWKRFLDKRTARSQSAWVTAYNAIRQGREGRR